MIEPAAAILQDEAFGLDIELGQLRPGLELAYEAAALAMGGVGGIGTAVENQLILSADLVDEEVWQAEPAPADMLIKVASVLYRLFALPVHC